jgi:cation:H+ antiporter
VYYATLTIGVLCAGFGGDLFVRGVVGIAHWSRISSGIIGATVAAFATSSPELSVAISSALAGKPQIALGDALGSNVVNVALILGAAAMISGVQAPRASVRRDFRVALLVPLLTGLICFDGVISRLDAAAMLLAFCGWLAATIRDARRQRSAARPVIGASHAWFAAAYCVGGLVLLIIAGYCIVHGARGIARLLGLEEFVIGATVVALGTSAPELATVVAAKLRGHDEVGLGTILGSNIFNGLFIVAVAAAVHPIAVVDARAVLGAVLFGAFVLICSFPRPDGFIARGRGVLLLSAYAAYLTVLLLSAPATGTSL